MDLASGQLRQKGFGVLTGAERLALEALADTVLPGCKRTPEDRAICGVSQDFGAVEAGALNVLTDPATGIAGGVAEMAQLLDEEAASYSNGTASVFADLAYAERRALLNKLISPETPMREFWVLVALFAYMAYDSAPHLPTSEALTGPHSGLAAMGFAGPEEDGRWRFAPHGYGRPLARLHPDTLPNGSLP